MTTFYLNHERRYGDSTPPGSPSRLGAWPRRCGQSRGTGRLGDL